MIRMVGIELPAGAATREVPRYTYRWRCTHRCRGRKRAPVLKVSLVDHVFVDDLRIRQLDGVFREVPEVACVGSDVVEPRLPLELLRSN